MKSKFILAALLVSFLEISAQQTPVFKMVKDINPSGDSLPENLIKLDSKIYFVADDGEHGKELWVTDGEETKLVKDINPGSNGSDIGNLKILNGKLIFTATDETNGNELWTSDGTEAGTVLVKDMYPGNGSSYAFEFVEFNNALYFRSEDGIHGTELWKTDGTTAGTAMVTDLREGEFGSNPSYFTVLNNKLYFNALDGFDYDNGQHGFELWVSDGTEAGTQMVKDIHAESSNPSNLKAFGNKIYFNADDGTNGIELWATDGTSGGTYMIKNINTDGNGNSLPSDFIDFNGKLFFTAYSSETGREIWTTDGTEAGTKILKDVYEGTENGVIPQFKYIIYNNKLFLTLRDAEHGGEIWVTDGTPEGTQLFMDVLPGPGDSMGITISPMLFQVMGGKLYFRAVNNEEYYQLWKSDGTVAGTQKITADPQNPSQDALGYTPYFTAMGDKLYFTAKYNDSGYELWTVTADEAMAVTDFSKNQFSVYPNPVADIINISGDSQISSVQVYDYSGKLLLGNPANTKKLQMNVSSLPKGNYVIKILSEQKSSSYKIIKK
ncbi:ELWxxDGT repeat protein [Epilithonimonas hungarica]|uniref:Por secretion system C-terminal sorting domain-containing protein n=1 Tax=Epilithonimonas hungarica TaxID=454006 RepID=A0A1G7HS08_9FLAO|nr:ELWxxDGT repeat protein [Epilithonimonas hungarica]SDF03202.1 Por secretion system C-terminal sorting domain-containing protein [Epilithonimonas hungarica]